MSSSGRNEGSFGGEREQDNGNGDKTVRGRERLGVGAVALFVFLSGAAWAGIVAAYFFAGAAGCGAIAVG
jgi:hypothetical protein